jgi:hypothetical protein
MPWSNQLETAPVQCESAGHFQALGQGDNAGIYKVHTGVAVLGQHPRRPPQVIVNQSLEDQIAVSKVLDERR